MLSLVDWAVPGALTMGFVALWLTSPATPLIRAMVALGYFAAGALWFWFRRAIYIAHVDRLLRDGQSTEALEFVHGRRGHQPALIKAHALMLQRDFASALAVLPPWDQIPVTPRAVDTVVSALVGTGDVDRAATWLDSHAAQLRTSEAAGVLAYCQGLIRAARGDRAGAAALFLQVQRDVRVGESLRQRAAAAVGY